MCKKAALNVTFENTDRYRVQVGFLVVGSKTNTPVLLTCRARTQKSECQLLPESHEAQSRSRSLLRKRTRVDEGAEKCLNAWGWGNLELPVGQNGDISSKLTESTFLCQWGQLTPMVLWMWGVGRVPEVSLWEYDGFYKHSTPAEVGERAPGSRR